MIGRVCDWLQCNKKAYVHCEIVMPPNRGRSPDPQDLCQEHAQRKVEALGSSAYDKVNFAPIKQEA